MLQRRVLFFPADDIVRDIHTLGPGIELDQNFSHSHTNLSPKQTHANFHRISIIRRWKTLLWTVNGGNNERGRRKARDRQRWRKTKARWFTSRQFTAAHQTGSSIRTNKLQKRVSLFAIIFHTVLFCSFTISLRRASTPSSSPYHQSSLCSRFAFAGWMLPKAPRNLIRSNLEIHSRHYEVIREYTKAQADAKEGRKNKKMKMS